MNPDIACIERKEQKSRRAVLVVPKQHVKTVKTALERHGKLDQIIKILPDGTQGPGDDAKEQNISVNPTDHTSLGRMRIATTIPYRSSDHSTSVDHKALLLDITSDLKISHISDDISISHHTPSANKTTVTPKNTLHKALQATLSNLPDTIFTISHVDRNALVSSFPEGYSIYPPLLLLPHNALISLPWTTLLGKHAPSSPALQFLWSNLATSMNVTHIAINSPIPLSQSSASSAENILRSPLNITPLYGDFGTTPTEENKHSPTQKDFNEALWVSTTQNGIHQVWAPLYIMFSRGNIREKTRVLNFPGPASSSTSSSIRGREAVIDMYSGIGYFSFSYRSSSFRPIFCFELNPWSVEGLRRGAIKNGWSYKIYQEEDVKNGSVDLDLEDGGTDFHIFQTSNIHALPLLLPNIHRGAIPPVRHVNLGLLPHSRDSWEDAVALVDKEVGGWIHAHENVGVVKLEERKGEVERTFQGYLDGEGKGMKAKVSHIERVKMYAPGVVHVVFDVWIGKTG